MSKLNGQIWEGQKTYQKSLSHPGKRGRLSLGRVANPKTEKTTFLLIQNLSFL